MAKVQTKMGGYTIHARKTEEFTFWWGDDYLPASYFDVSITAVRLTEGTISA